MQRAATEEGMNSFAAQASANDWNNMQNLAAKWLESGDPSLIAQAARVYDYMMPGSGIDFSGKITAANAERFKSWMADAQALAAQGNMTEEEIADYLAGSGYFDRDMAAEVARKAMRSEYEITADMIKRDPVFQKLAADNGVDIDEFANMLAMGDLSDLITFKDGKAYWVGDGGSGDGGAGGYSYQSGISKVNDEAALELASVPVKDGDGNPLELPADVARKRQVLINDINNSILRDPPDLSIAQAVHLYRDTPLWDDLMATWENAGVIRDFNHSQNNLTHGVDKYYNNRLFRIGDGVYQYVGGDNGNGFKMVNVKDPNDVKLVDGRGNLIYDNGYIVINGAKYKTGMRV